MFYITIVLYGSLSGPVESINGEFLISFLFPGYEMSASNRKDKECLKDKKNLIKSVLKKAWQWPGYCSMDWQRGRVDKLSLDRLPAFPAAIHEFVAQAEEAPGGETMHNYNGEQ